MCALQECYNVNRDTSYSQVCYTSALFVSSITLAFVAHRLPTIAIIVHAIKN